MVDRAARNLDQPLIAVLVRFVSYGWLWPRLLPKLGLDGLFKPEKRKLTSNYGAAIHSAKRGASRFLND